jgi:hypothetical protein
MSGDVEAKIGRAEARKSGKTKETIFLPRHSSALHHFLTSQRVTVVSDSITAGEKSPQA